MFTVIIDLITSSDNTCCFFFSSAIYFSDFLKHPIILRPLKDVKYVHSSLFKTNKLHLVEQRYFFRMNNRLDEQLFPFPTSTTKYVDTTFLLQKSFNS